MATAGPGTGGSRSQTASPRVQGAFPWPPFPAIESLPCSWHGGPGQHHEQNYGTEYGTSYGTMPVHSSSSERDQALVTWEAAMAEAQGVPIEVVEAITITCGVNEDSVLRSLPAKVHEFWRNVHTGAVGLDNAADAQQELENAVKEVFAWADSQKALQIATMHTNAFLTMQRRLRRMRGSPTALMTPMVLRLGHETLFFDERYTQFVQLSSDITERMDSDPNAVFLGWRDNGDEAWMDRSRTAPRGAPQPKRRQFSRGAGLSSDTSAGFAFYGADTGDGRHFPHNVRDMHDVHDIPHYSRGSGHHVQAWPLTCLVQVNKGRCITHPRNQRRSVAVGTAASMRKHRRQ